MKNIYLDYAAATPVDPAVLKAIHPYFTAKFHNPSATYLAARGIRRALEQARAKVAGHLGAKPAEIIFTAGATEANNLAIQGVMKQFPAGEILISAIEHESVLEPAKLFNNRLVPVNKQGRVDLAKLQKMIGPNTVMVSIGMVNNEIGVLQPLREIAKILKGTNILLHSDAAQAPNFFDLHVSRLGIDLLSLNGGKIYGPKQSGALYIKTGTRLLPLIAGGGQESNLRSGTENVAADIGLAKALTLAQTSKKQEYNRVEELRQLFISQLKQTIPSAILNGPVEHAAPHILSISFPTADNERLVMELDEQGIQAAVGSACSASSEEPSHVLRAIGLDEERAHTTLRFSFGRQTTKTDIKRTVETLAKLLD